MKAGLFVVALSTLVASTAMAADKVDLSSTDAKISYAVGLQIGEGLVSEGVPIDMKALRAGIEDVVAKNERRLAPEELQTALVDFQRQKMEAMAKVAEENKAKGEKYRAENKKKKGVIQTASGLQYKVVSAGKGKKPGPTDMVTVNYRGTLINGEEFDSSYSRGEPATFPVNGVIQGWQEVLPLMKEGEKVEVAIPAELAYGERGTGTGIGPNETLLFEIELLEVKASPHGSDAGAMGAGHPH